jgi:NADH-quinone oxidoreductase E subunit
MVISGELRARIEEVCARYPHKRGGLLPALHLTQAEHGFVSREVVEELASVFDLHPVEVMEVVSFYTMFHSEPQGRHQVRVCTNLPCSLRGARGLMKQIEAHLGLSGAGTTSDSRITFGHEECLGACAYAPMMRVDDDYHEDLDLEKAKQILDELV